MPNIFGLSPRLVVIKSPDNCFINSGYIPNINIVTLYQLDNRNILLSFFSIVFSSLVSGLRLPTFPLAAPLIGSKGEARSRIFMLLSFKKWFTLPLLYRWRICIPLLSNGCCIWLEFYSFVSFSSYGSYSSIASIWKGSIWLICLPPAKISWDSKSC